MKHRWSLLFLTGLAGCASVSDLKTSTPYATFSSNLAAQTVAECIRDAWQSQRIGYEANGAVLQQSGTDFTVVSPPGGFPSEVAEVKSIAGSTTVSIFTQASVDLGGRKKNRTASAKTCM